MKNQISLFKTVASKDPQTVAVNLVYDAIIQGRWKNQVEAIRLSLKQGDKKRMDRQKKNLVYVLYSGVAEGGHRASQLTTYTGRISLDYDKVPCELLKKLRDMAMELPCTECAFISASGQGLKVVVQTNATREQHAEAYAQATTHYDRRLGISSDKACKDISRGHFISHDPEATYREVTQPFLVMENPEASSAPKATMQEPIPALRITPLQEIRDFVRSYLALFPAVEGERNLRLFRLACEACKRDYPRDPIVLEAHSQMGADDFGMFEVRQTVNSAYSRKGENGEKSGASYCQVSAKMPSGTNENTFLEGEDSETPDGEDLREHTPTFPEEVFTALPEFLQSSLQYCDNSRERDMFLLSIITVLSGVFYNADGIYARKLYSPHLFTFVVAPPASGKGIMENALKLCKYYFQEVNAENEKLTKKYKEELEAYEVYVREHKGKKTITGEKKQKPEPPAYFFPDIPVNTSKSRFTAHLKENGKRGGLMFSLEADTLSGANKQDYGDFMELLRNIFEHERVAHSFVKDTTPVYVYDPRVALFLAGTPAQQVRLFASTEDGGFSRFLNYTLRQRIFWMDVSPGNDEEEMQRHIDQLAMRLHQMIRFLNTSHTRIKLSPEQWGRLNSVFSKLLEECGMSDREDFLGSVKRHGVMTFRVCMVLTLLEKATFRMDVSQMVCSDEHFEAALTIVTTCLEHGRLLITSLPKTDNKYVELQNPDKMKMIIRDLPTEFTYAEFLLKAERHKLSPRTAARLIKTVIGKKINRIGRGVYSKKA